MLDTRAAQRRRHAARGAISKVRAKAHQRSFGRKTKAIFLWISEDEQTPHGRCSHQLALPLFASSPVATRPFG